MIKLYQVILLCYICLILFLLIDMGEANENTRIRQKRYLSFSNITKFFLRLNFKANMVPWTQIFAQALGFRLNWDDPPDSIHPYHHLTRRSIYSHMETLLDRNGLNGMHCIRRAICEIRMINEPKCIYHRILKMVFRFFPDIDFGPMKKVVQFNDLCIPLKIAVNELRKTMNRSSDTDKWHNMTMDECQLSVTLCPFSILEVSLYTDI